MDTFTYGQEVPMSPFQPTFPFQAMMTPAMSPFQTMSPFQAMFPFPAMSPFQAMFPFPTMMSSPATMVEKSFEWTFIDETSEIKFQAEQQLADDSSHQQFSASEYMQSVKMLILAANAEEEEEKSHPRGTKRKRVSTACDNCRVEHLSCTGRPFWDIDGGQDCSGCARRNLECQYTPRPVKKPRKH